MWGVEACLDKILAFGLGDEGLELCGCESVDETCFGDDEEEDLGACEGRELVCLMGVNWKEKMIKMGRNVTFFMIPVNRHVRREEHDFWRWRTYQLSFWRTLYDVSIYPG